jgi:hypothetical protein
LNAGTSTIKFTNSSSSTKTFGGGGKTYNIVWFAPGAGTGGFYITGANTFNELKDDGSVGHTITFPVSITQTVTTFNINGSSAANRLQLRSSFNGTRFILSKSSGDVVVDYLDIKDSQAQGGATWTADHPINNGNNSGWVFLIKGYSFGMILE